MKKLIVLLTVLLLILSVSGLTVFLVLRNVELPFDNILDFSSPDDKKSDDDFEFYLKRSEKYHDLIVKYAEKYEVPVALVYAVIECESSFKEDSKSHVGACGLMQLMPVTYNDIREWKGFDYSDEQIMDPQVNIECGTYYLSRLYRTFDDWELAVAAYNAGPGNVQKWLKNEEYTDDGKLVYIPFSETSAHVEKVVKAWNKYEKHLKG